MAMAGSWLAAMGATAACRAPEDRPTSSAGTLTARPMATRTTVKPGRHPLGFRDTRDGLLVVPPRAVDTPVPLIVLCHGAGGAGARLLERLEPATASAGAAILAPDSAGSTWDLMQPEPRTVLDIVDLFTGSRRFVGFGPDVAFINRALDYVFQNVAVDPDRIVVAGFSDGATYALSLGLINGDLFRRIVAFSPGFFSADQRRGRPDIFVSHGRADDILPIARTTRRIVPGLQQEGYSITLREFEGGHELPDAITREAMRWAVA